MCKIIADVMLQFCARSNVRADRGQNRHLLRPFCHRITMKFVIFNVRIKQRGLEFETDLRRVKVKFRRSDEGEG